jgi:flagellar biogenesis protein FliO
MENGFMDTVETNERVAQSGSLFTRLVGSAIRLLRSVRVRHHKRFLRICETLPLGEKRFLALVQFERQRFLIGVTQDSIALLDRLGDGHAPGEEKGVPERPFLDEAR